MSCFGIELWTHASLEQHEQNFGLGLNLNSFDVFITIMNNGSGEKGRGTVNDLRIEKRCTPLRDGQYFVLWLLTSCCPQPQS